MAGFYIVKKGADSERISLKLRDSFRERGFKVFTDVETKEYLITHINKILIETPNIIINNDGFILSHGTLIYKKKTGKKALELLYADLNRKEIDNNKLFGHFNIVYSLEGNLRVISDAYTYLPIYKNNNEEFYSTSFISMCDTVDSLTVNKEVVIENTITGCLISENTTYFNEIERVNFNYQNRESLIFSKLPFYIENKKNRSSFEKELKEQIEYINFYYNNIGEVFKSGVDIGLSAGFDSRLMLAITNKFFSNRISTHTHWKKKEDNEIKVSKLLSIELNIPLKQVEVKLMDDLKSEDKNSIALESLYFYDGQIRVNHSIFSEYRNIKYRKEILGGVKSGVAGLGGEQYRNDLSFFYNSYDLDMYIKEFIFDSVESFEFNNEKIHSKIIKNIKTQLLKYTDLKSQKRISFQNIREYYNRIWVKSGPGFRNVAENQLTYYLSPFNDPYLSEKGLKISTLGKSVKFQARLIKYFNADLAKIISDYGINFYENNLWYRLKRAILGLVLVKKSSRSKFQNIGKKKNKIKQLEDEYFLKLIKTYKDKIPELTIDEVSVKSNMFNRVCGFAFLFNLYSHKIKNSKCISSYHS